MVQCEHMHDFPFLYSPYAPILFTAISVLVAIGIFWVIAIKGYALWHAARNNQKWWFIALLVINTVGILEIIYLICYRPKNNERVAETPVDSASSGRD